MARVAYLRKLLGFTVFTMVSATPAFAQFDTDKKEDGTLSLLFENDIFYKTDRDYSNGVQVGWTTGPADNIDWAVNLARFLPFFAQDGEVRMSYSVGQNIYTPRDITLSNPPLTDRPYAGFLYGGMGVIDRSGNDLDQLQVQLGVIGPASLAQESQTLVHRIINDREPEGWHYQLRDEPALNITYEHSWRWRAPSILGFQFDVDPHIGAAVGNVYDYINAGAMARFGWNVPDDYGPIRIDPSSPGSNFFERAENGPIGAYVFAGVDGRAIARNIFLDGNSFVDSRSVTKKPFVGDLQLGAAITLGGTRITFTHVMRTKEFKTQPDGDQFGAVNVSFRF
ncbi:MAG TPA: lipid A deacylase LpxR family protein [Rhizomicrobium sp.]